MNQVGSSTETAIPRLLIGASAWVREVQEEVRRIAPFTSSVLISGPSGTGKELIARDIHAQSRRASQPFIAVNCAAFTGTLFESQMFGHLKGSFTGAQHAAMGCFRAADGGTIFLDEIGELDIDLQAKSLRVLQEQVVVPLGSHEEVPVDVRVLAATNRDLIDEVRQRRFREDLYYRLAVVTIRTIPLRDRLEDLEVLVEYLLTQQCVKHGLPYKPLSTGALACLRRHPWPGNVRELQNALERAVVVSGPTWIEASDLELNPSRVQATPPDEIAADVACGLTHSGSWNHRVNARRDPGWPEPVESDGHWMTIQELEKWHIRTTLEHTAYNQTEAARLLDIDRSVLRRRIQKHGLDVSRSRPGRPPR